MLRRLSSLFDRALLAVLRSAAAEEVRLTRGHRGCRRWRRRRLEKGRGWSIRRRGRGRSSNGGRREGRRVHNRAGAKKSSWLLLLLPRTILVDRPIRRGTRVGRRDRCRRGGGVRRRRRWIRGPGRYCRSSGRLPRWQKQRQRRSSLRCHPCRLRNNRHRYHYHRSRSRPGRIGESRPPRLRRRTTIIALPHRPRRSVRPPAGEALRAKGPSRLRRR